MQFQIPDSKPSVEKELVMLMRVIKQKVSEYKNVDRFVLEKHFNSIAFLFKSDAYKNENEIRLVEKVLALRKK